MTLRREVAAVSLLFTLLGLVYTYPLIRHFSTGIPYVRFPAPGAEVKWMQAGDSLQLYYWWWLMKDNLTGGSPLFTNPYEFDVTPVLPPQRYGFYQFPLSLVFVLLSPFGGAFAYNGVVILSFPLAAAAMYLLVRLYTERKGCALVGALIFALAPFRLGQLLGGHSNGLLFFLFPLTLYCYEQGLRRGRVAFGLLAGLCLASLALSDFHLLYYLLLFSAGYWIVRGVEVLDLPWRDGLRGLLAAAARSPGSTVLPLATGGIVGGALGLSLLRRGVAVPHVLLAVGAGVVLVAAAWFFSALTYLGPGPAVPARIGLSAALRRGAFTLTPLFVLSAYGLQWSAEIPRLGRLLVAIALVGVALLQVPALLALVRHRWGEVRRLLRVLFPVAAVALCCVGYVLFLKATIMGASFTAGGGRPYLLIARNSPTLSDLQFARNPDDERAIYVGILPAFLGIAGLVRGWREGSQGTRFMYGMGSLLGLILSLGPSLDSSLPLYRLLYAHLPYFNYPRSPARLMILTFMGVGVLAGSAIRLLPRGKVWSRVALSALVIGIGVEYAPFRAVGITLLDAGNPVYRTVGSEVGDGRFLAIPLFPGDSHQSSVYQFYVTTTRARMVNGYNPLVSRSYVGGIFDRLVNLNLGEMRQAEYDLLKALRVRFLVVHEDLFFWKVSPFPGYLTVENLMASPYLSLRGKAGDLSLLELRQEPAGPPQRLGRSSPVGSLHEAEDLPRRTGREVVDPEASNGRAVAAREGRDGAGYLTLGVAPSYPSGAYLAAFRLKLDGLRPPGSVATIDVSADRGRRVLAEREITAADFAREGEYEEFDLQWSIDAPSRVEFRVNYRGRGDLWADRVYVSFLDQASPAVLYEAEALLRHGAEVRADAEASGDAAVYIPAPRPESYPVFGPYRRYPPGRYEARFRLKLDPGPDGIGEVAAIEVSADRGRRQLASQTVARRSLSPPGRYHEVRLPFTVDRPAVLEFRVRHGGLVALWIDRVTVLPAGDSR